MLSVILPPSEHAAGGEDQDRSSGSRAEGSSLFPVLRHPRIAGHAHGRSGHRALADRVAGHLEQAAIGREFGELPAGVAGDAVLSGLAIERRQRHGFGGPQRRQDDCHSRQ